MKLLMLSLLATLPAHAENLCDPLPNPIAQTKEILKKQGRLPASLGAGPTVGTTPGYKWNLVWTGGLEKDGALDPTKWVHETGGDGWGNDEDEFYTNQLKNAHIKNGVMKVNAIKETFQNKEYTSARVHSQQSFTYGRFEFVAKYPKGRGTWPAIWMLPDATTYGHQYWPDNGELDILEGVGHEPGINHASAHNLTYNFAPGHILHSRTIPVDNMSEDFHSYVMEWLPDHIDFYLDDKLYYTVDKDPGADWRSWPYDKDFHIIANVAIGGFWGRAQGIDDSAFPTSLEVKSVKVYRPAIQAMCQPGAIPRQPPPAEPVDQPSDSLGY